VKYHVFRPTWLGNYKEIAQTVDIQDAQVVLAQYTAGYIANEDGEIIQKKGI
jgi:hypothetical protein